MHELSITESILEIALRHAAEAEAKKITDIHLVIGKLSSIVDDSVQFYWDIVSDGSAAQGAVLHFRRVRIEIACQACGEVYHPEELDLSCPACGSRDVRIVAGEEFRLEAIEVE
ncbi:MAG: hydrogenase maturation nickel metallochaperone HypA [Anaerolineales bacterium]|nr:MAG: hydrogenase maturation nickel metallochaperone HypA [Anaerolineales bacterium]